MTRRLRTIKSDDGPPALVIIWQEENGPRVNVPLRKGFGSWIIRDLTRLEFGAQIVKTYEAAGFRRQIVLPLDVMEG